MPLAILFGFAFTVIFCFALGFPFASRLPLYRQERWPLAFVLGSAMLSGITFALCAVQQAKSGALIALCIAAIAFAWESNRMPAGPELPALPRLPLWLFLALFVPFTVLYAANAMAPEWSPDGSSYHLGWVARYAAAGGFVSPRDNMYGMLSQGVELLFLNAFLFGKHSAAAMVHWAFLLDLVWLLVCFGRRIGKPEAGLAAAIFVYASPVVGIDGTSAYIDLATACIGFALFYLLYVWDGVRSQSLLIAAGLLAGLTYAAKYTTAVLAIWALIVVVWRSRSWKQAAAFSAMTLVLSAPWMIRNAVYMGNPFAPFFNRLFPNPYVHVLFEQNYSEWLRNYGVANFWQLPLEVTIRGEKTTGLLGYLFLLSPLALLALRWKPGRWLLGAALAALLPYSLNIGTRFLIPALPFVAMALAMTLDSRFLLPVLMIAHSILAWPNWPPGLLTKTVPSNAWKLIRMPWKAALRIEKEADFLNRRHDGYRIARLVDAHLKPGERVLRTNGHAESYSDRELIVGYQSANNEKLLDILYTGIDDARWPRLVWRFKLPQSREARVIRVVQTFPVTVRDEQWTIAEIRLFRDEIELPRDAAWRLSAKPNPWDVQMAFDNSPVTRWRSWEMAKPGMHVEMDLGKPSMLTEVRVEATWDCAHCRVKLLLDGRETAIEPTQENVEPKVWMRREATRELLARGVHYLMFADDEFPGHDLYVAHDEWGVKFVAEESGARLFRIEPYVEKTKP